MAGGLPCFVLSKIIITLKIKIRQGICAADSFISLNKANDEYETAVDKITESYYDGRF